MASRAKVAIARVRSKEDLLKLITPLFVFHSKMEGLKQLGRRDGFEMKLDSLLARKRLLVICSTNGECTKMSAREK